MPYALASLFRWLEHIVQTHRPMTLAACRDRPLDETDAVLLLRFDIERRISHACEIADRLHQMNVQATFFAHARPQTFRAHSLRYIASLGHEVGLHYECLDVTRGDFPAARELFKRQCQAFRAAGIALTFVSAHAELGARHHGYTKNEDLFARYPDLMDEEDVQDAQRLIRARFAGRIMMLSDQLKQQLRHPARPLPNARPPGIVHVLLHPHRWDHLPSSAAQIATDLWFAGQNWVLGHRLYRASTTHAFLRHISPQLS